MSALRLGRLPDGTRDIRIVDDGAVGRIHMTRYAIAGSIVVARKPPELPPSQTPERVAQVAAYRAQKRGVVEDRAQKNPDNGVVKTSSVEVQR